MANKEKKNKRKKNQQQQKKLYKPREKKKREINAKKSFVCVCVFLFDQVSSCACWATWTKKSYLFAFCSPHCAQRNGLSGE
jgi:hypothetical protein